MTITSNIIPDFAQAEIFAADPPMSAEEIKHRFCPTNAYAEWLWNELKFLNREMGYDSTIGLYSPMGTIGGDFHFPRDHRDWSDVPPPSTRAETILRVLGIIPQEDIATAA
ncbi:hypothetical protein [Neorhizobium alkalisoli]|uniref:Uncharacterized protein n=1 Tax=Neorhizobium alkalisoli TaxID=528178 RepID=A0A561Q7S7_9HYPH|nr:hypothetical protein [Neorhizobium alkalisoli]TWF46408.1 hypothetical protein FHW37_115105 [Neorhizobium alkalisoli]